MPGVDLSLRSVPRPDIKKGRCEKGQPQAQEVRSGRRPSKGPWSVKVAEVSVGSGRLEKDTIDGESDGRREGARSTMLSTAIELYEGRLLFTLPLESSVTRDMDC